MSVRFTELSDYLDLPAVFNFAPIKAKWRREPEDFRVEEVWTDEPTGEGEHVLLWVEKRDQNTDWIARSLARACGLRDVDVGYMGMKDRFAVTRQWYSLHLVNKPEPDWNRVSIEGVKILRSLRHSKKLRRGDHQGNRFQIRLSSFAEPVQEPFNNAAGINEGAGVKERVESALSCMKESGFPNYFGYQRFGHDGYNLNRAEHWFTEGKRPKKRPHRGLYLSAARSHLFNLILAERERRGDWSQCIEGDVVLPAASSCFENKAESPTGPLPGGAEFLEGEAGAVEKAAVTEFQSWLAGIHREGARTQRRPFVSLPESLTWRWNTQNEGQEGHDGQEGHEKNGEGLVIEFGLGVGSFASTFLGQIFDLSDERTFNKTTSEKNTVEDSSIQR